MAKMSDDVLYILYFEEIQFINVCYVDNKSFLSNFLNTNKNKDSNMKFNCKIILDFYNFPENFPKT